MAANIAAVFWFIAGASSATAVWLMIMRARMYRDTKRRAR